jgi:hypothetical protein
VNIVLERREQIALAAGTVDDREVAARQFEQVARDLWTWSHDACHLWEKFPPMWLRSNV